MPRSARSLVRDPDGGRGLTPRPGGTADLPDRPAGPTGPWSIREILVPDFMDKATEAVNQHDKQVDQALQKAGDHIDERTGGGQSDQIDQGVDAAQQHTGSGDQS